MATIIAQLPQSACADRLVYPLLQDINDLYITMSHGAPYVAQQLWKSYSFCIHFQIESRLSGI
jgi:hypothetical protein